MAYIVHQQLMDDQLIKRWFVKEKKSIAEVVEITKAPYGCVKNRARRVLTEKQFGKIPRERQRYTAAFKRKIAKLTQRHSIKDVANSNNLHIELVRAWVRQMNEGLLPPASMSKRA